MRENRKKIGESKTDKGRGKKKNEDSEREKWDLGSKKRVRERDAHNKVCTHTYECIRMNKNALIHMVFNLNAPYKSVIGPEGRTCRYPHRVQTSALALCFSQSHIFRLFFMSQLF